VKQVVCSALTIYMVVLFGRAIFSWFPVRPGTGLASVYRVLFELTEPVMKPLRRIIPPAGMFDLSFLVLIIGIRILLGVMHCSALLF